MMFPAPMPPMPPEIMDAAAADPAGFADALATGMEAFQGAMGEAGDMGAAFEAMGDVMAQSCKTWVFRPRPSRLRAMR